jgi:putative protease
MPELLAPAGDFPSLVAAIESGADSIYFGIKNLNMRSSSANNFSINDLLEIKKYCKKHKTKAYLTLNTIIYDEDIPLMQEICEKAKEAKIDAIIAADLSTITYAKKIGLNVHISTQSNISNTNSLKFFSKFASVFVLARELNLTQIKKIRNNIKKHKIYGPDKKPIKLEIFIHGAMCVAISGKCYMSLFQYNKSANRGNCLQACRRKYRVMEEETKKELLIDNNFIMSPKDLCTISFLDKILKTGVDILKIEGRARSAEYVKIVTKTYREALNSIENNTYTPKKIEKWISILKTVYNRGFWHGGYYLNESLNNWSNFYGSKASKKKIYIGKVTNFFSKINICELLIHSNSLKVSDDILIIGNKTGAIFYKIKNLRRKRKILVAKKGDLVTFSIPKKIRKNDKVYLIKNA